MNIRTILIIVVVMATIIFAGCIANETTYYPPSQHAEGIQAFDDAMNESMINAGIHPDDIESFNISIKTYLDIIPPGDFTMNALDKARETSKSLPPWEQLAIDNKPIIKYHLCHEV